MSNELIPPDPELTAIEQELASLAPARSRLDRDRVMFRAGQAAASPRSPRPHLWFALAASLGLVALGEAVLLARRPTERIVEKIVVVREPAAAPAPARPEVVERTPPAVPARLSIDDEPSLGRTAYDRLAGQVLRYGLDGLPASPSGVWNDSQPWPTSAGELLREELRKTLEPGDPS